MHLENHEYVRGAVQAAHPPDIPRHRQRERPEGIPGGGQRLRPLQRFRRGGHPPEEGGLRRSGDDAEPGNAPRAVRDRGGQFLPQRVRVRRGGRGRAEARFVYAGQDFQGGNYQLEPRRHYRTESRHLLHGENQRRPSGQRVLLHGLHHQIPPRILPGPLARRPRRQSHRMAQRDGHRGRLQSNVRKHPGHPRRHRVHRRGARPRRGPQRNLPQEQRWKLPLLEGGARGGGHHVARGGRPAAPSGRGFFGGGCVERARPQHVSHRPGLLPLRPERSELFPDRRREDAVQTVPPPTPRSRNY
mmetsp:Transcript_17128/g.34101  ORF Transcript_17128/g.34101 Transcript_17128/m.34101 type:complete len:301 (+) Transcript_17128:268-1170(+)